VYREYVAAPLVQPGEHRHLLAPPKVPHGFAKLGQENDTRQGSTLVALFGGVVAVGKRRFHPSDRPQYVCRIIQLEVLPF